MALGQGPGAGEVEIEDGDRGRLAKACPFDRMIATEHSRSDDARTQSLVHARAAITTGPAREERVSDRAYGRAAFGALKSSPAVSSFDWERQLARLFNAYLIVDWSAAAKPITGADSVWIGVLKRDVRFRFAFEAHNPATRAEAEAMIGAILDDRAKRRERTLLGFDFALGLPRGLTAGLGLTQTPPWKAVWSEIDKRVKDRKDNVNNRFGAASEINRRLTGGPFPFWGCPPKDALTTLQPKKTRDHGPGDLPEFRFAEEAAKGASPVWKMYYNGSVGGQTLLGIPVAKRLAEARADRLKVWPFETGWKALSEAELDGVDAVMAEIYPSLIKPAALPGEVKDQTQVRCLAEHFARLDEQGKLAAMFGPPAGAAAERVSVVEQEEGWILGA